MAARARLGHAKNNADGMDGRDSDIEGVEKWEGRSTMERKKMSAHLSMTSGHCKSERH